MKQNNKILIETLMSQQSPTDNNLD